MNYDLITVQKEDGRVDDEGSQHCKSIYAHRSCFVYVNACAYRHMFNATGVLECVFAFSWRSIKTRAEKKEYVRAMYFY